jgi:hypothetical protein
MDERFWIRRLPWRKKNKADSKSAQIKFAPQLEVTREDGWTYLELQLVNRSSWTVWVQEASVVLADLDADMQTVPPTGQGRFQILQNVGPNETSSVSLARTIYDAAGRPPGPYSCLVTTNVRYHVFDEWCSAKLMTCRVGMAALTAVGLRSAHWYDKKIKKIKQINDSVLQRKSIKAKQHCVERGSYMIVEAERLVCTNHECGAEFVVTRKPAIEKQKPRCCCGSELKKLYHSPVLRVLGTGKSISEHALEKI